MALTTSIPSNTLNGSAKLICWMEGLVVVLPPVENEKQGQSLADTFGRVPAGLD